MTSAPLLPSLARRVQRRITFGLALSETAVFGALLLFAVGAVVLLGRSFTDIPRTQWSFAFLALLALPLIVARRMRGRGWSRRDVAAWLDVHSGGAGLLVAQEELGADPAWSARLNAPLARVPDPPGIGFGRALARLAPAGLFAAAALWVQLPQRTQPGPPVSLLNSLIGRLEGQLAFLDEGFTLDPGTLAELGGRLARLRASLGEEDGSSPLSSEALFAALDGIESSLGLEADRARNGARELLENIAAQAGDGQGLAQALGGAVGALQESGLARELAPGLLRKLAQSGALQSIASGMGANEKDAGSWLENIDMDPAQASELLRSALAAGSALNTDGSLPGLLEATEWLGGELGASVEEMALRGLVDGPLEVPSAWRELASRLGSLRPGASGLGTSGSGTPGGGPGFNDFGALWGQPGPSSALGSSAPDGSGTSDSEASSLTASLQLSPLPPGTADARRSALLDVVPGAGTETGSSEWAGLQAVPEGPAAAAWKRRLSPDHRRVVRNFFSEDPKD